MTNNSQIANQSALPASAQPCPPPAVAQILAYVEARNLTGEFNKSTTRFLKDSIVRQLNGYGRPLQTSIDPVLQDAINLSLSRDTCEEVWYAALFKLERNLDDYQQILGEYLPNDLVDAVTRQIQSKAYNDGSNSTAADDLNEYIRRRTQQKMSSVCFPIGIPAVDDDLYGGIRGLAVLLGDKGVGKTWLTINCVSENIIDPATCVLYYALDATKSAIMDRLVCRELGITYRELMDGQTCQLVSRLEDPGFRDKLSRLRILERNCTFEGDQTSGEAVRHGITEHTIVDDAVKLIRESDTRRIVVIIDLFQKMVSPSTVSSTEEDKFRLDTIGNAIQRLDKWLGEGSVAFLVTSEMRKRDGHRSNQRPTRDDIKGDGRIASDAGCILILSTDQQIDGDVNDVILDIDKGRDGVYRTPHKLRFDHRRGVFSPRESVAEPRSTTTVPGDQSPFEE